MKTNVPYGLPEWNIWKHFTELPILDAVCLSMNICPREASEEYGIKELMRGDDDEGHGGPRIDDAEVRQLFHDRLFTLNREFGRKVELEKFVYFATKAEWIIPPELSTLSFPKPVDVVKRDVLSVGISPAPSLPPEGKIIRHKIRMNLLDTPIQKAIKLADSVELGAVWLQLKNLALDCEPPFTGEVDLRSLCYTDDKNKPAKLSKDALRHRLKGYSAST